jgi:hypothetical protein
MALMLARSAHLAVPIPLLHQLIVHIRQAGGENSDMADARVLLVVRIPSWDRQRERRGRFSDLGRKRCNGGFTERHHHWVAWLWQSRRLMREDRLDAGRNIDVVIRRSYSGLASRNIARMIFDLQLVCIISFSAMIKNASLIALGSGFLNVSSISSFRYPMPLSSLETVTW